MEQRVQQGRGREAWRWFSQAISQHDSFLGYFQPFIQLALPRWSSDAYRAKVVAVRTELDDMYSLILRPSPSGFERRWSGFQAGQFIDLMVERDGARLLRCFSISSSPDYFRRTGLIELSIAMQPQGRLTPWLKQGLKVADVVNISAAKGTFMLADESPAEPLLMIAGGTGVTPFRAMLQQSAQRRRDADICVLYYHRGHPCAFGEELRHLEGELPNLRVQLINSTEQGRICVEHINAWCGDVARRRVMLCGPAAMIQASRRCLHLLDVPDKQIQQEYFGVAPVDVDAPVLKSSSGPDGMAQQAVAVFFRCSGKQHKMSADIADRGRSLLNLAEEAGLNPPSGCRIGVCHQCICQKRSGVTYNMRTQEYSDSGPGEVQLCISRAVSDVVLDL